MSDDDDAAAMTGQRTTPSASALRSPAAPESPSPEHLRLAAWIEGGSRLGLTLLVLSFLAYVSGLLPAGLAVERLPAFWGLPLDEYLRRSGQPTGWGWVGWLGHGDLSGLAGIAVLVGCMLPGLAALLPLFWRGGERAIAWLCAAEVLVLALAASGLLSRSAG